MNIEMRILDIERRLNKIEETLQSDNDDSTIETMIWTEEQ